MGKAEEYVRWTVDKIIEQMTRSEIMRMRKRRR